MAGISGTTPKTHGPVVKEIATNARTTPGGNRVARTTAEAQAARQDTKGHIHTASSTRTPPTRQRIRQPHATIAGMSVPESKKMEPAVPSVITVIMFRRPAAVSHRRKFS